VRWTIFTVSSGLGYGGRPRGRAAATVPAEVGPILAPVPFTLVAFHAHPDDEALLTAGTMARASAEGHRVVLVVATDGGAGLASRAFLAGDEGLAARRSAELRRSAAALGCARVVELGYADSGLDGAAEPPPGRLAFAWADVDEPAAALVEVLVEESADVLTSYDARGGYGHPDHVQVHRVAARAADLAGTPVLLEATVERERLAAAVRAVGRVYRYPPEFDVDAYERAYTPRSEITHRVDVRRYAVRKRTAMAAHASQATADGGDRTLAALLRLPIPVFRQVLGTEWYVERGRRAGGPALDDVFASLHGGNAGR
jgi:LmbE family N-acetylglucosaminyl deacetylase